MLRKATQDDIPRMIALQKAVEEDDVLWGYAADSLKQWVQRDLSWSIVVDCGGDLGGYIYCHPRPYAGECIFPADSKVLEIAELLIADGQRNRGLGEELVTAIRQQAQEEGFTHLRVYSAAKRFDGIVKFYRRCGFTPWYVEMTQRIGVQPTVPGDVRDGADEP
jgi:GNAT superfamily N-acetyltransferase